MTMVRLGETALWAIAVLCACYFLSLDLSGRLYHAAAMQISTVPITSPVSAEVETPGAASSLMGRLDIPEIGLSVPILAGAESESLQHGLFHIKGTAMPGGLGTVGLAGHRDTYFRPLRRITNKMGIQLVDSTGMYHYAIDSTEIVTPDKVEVLDIREQPELTLITCYPFDFVGAAPKRFIVHAHLVSASPDAVSAAGK